MPAGLLGGLALAVAAVLALTGYFLLQSRNVQFERAADSAETLAKVLERYVYATIQATDSALETAVEGYRDMLADGRPIERDFTPFIDKLGRHLPHGAALAATDAGGQLKYGSVLKGARPNIADLERFRQARESSGLVISAPMQTRVIGHWALPLTRRLGAPDGSFAGVVATNIKVEWFGDLFASLKAGDHAAIILFDAGTHLWVRHPEPKGPGSVLGLKVGSPEFKALWQQGIRSATYRAQSTTDGVWRTYSYRQVGDYPLFVMVGIADEDTLAPWHMQATVAAGFLAVFLGLVAYLLRSLAHSQARQRAAFRDSIDAQGRLAESESRLMLAQEGAHVGVWEFDVASGHAYWSPECRRLYGFGPDVPASNDEWRRRVHPDDLGCIDAQWMTTIAQREPFDVEFRMCLEGGETRWLQTRGRAQYDDAGRPVRLSGINLDITERKQLEHTLHDRMLELATILDNSSVGITFVRQRVQVWANRRMGEMFGYTTAEMKDQGVRMFYLAQEDYEEVGRLAYAALARGERFVVEREMRHRDGHRFWCRFSGKAIDAAVEMEGSIWVFEDISEQMKVQADLVRAKNAADAASVAKSQFLATMSHEIRTPLNGVLGMAQLLLMPGVGEEERLDYARTILNSGQTLLTLLNDILDMSKVEAGRLELESIVFDAAQLVHETGALFAETARKKGLALVLDTEGLAGRRFLGDPTRLRQMLGNLVSNAIKFTEAGCVRIDVLEVRREERTAVLGFAVSDTGMGIPADKLEKLFLPFSQLDGSITRQFGGTGLGLSIVRSLARQMGGDVGVSSRAGEGTCFWFHVCVGIPEAGTESRREEREPGAPAAGAAGRSRHVLVVEDNATNRTVITAMLRKQGVEVAVAEDGRQAVDAITAAEQPPDLVLMDVQMPVMDGLEATRQLRRWEAAGGRSRLPIVALTAGAFQEDHQRCEEAGMDDFLAKPLHIGDLVAVLDRWLGSRPSPR